MKEKKKKYILKEKPERIMNDEKLKENKEIFLKK